MPEAEGEAQFAAVKGAFSRETELRRELADRTGAAFSNVFSFLEQAVGQSQELVLFVTEITAGFDTSWFVEEFGCEAYFRHNKELLFDERRQQILDKTGVFRQAVCGVASVDRKKEEEGLLSFAREWALPVRFYTAEELMALPGTFTASEFVRRITGVDCVCERSAVMLALDTAAEQAAALLAKKESLGGVTAALAFIEPEFGGAAALR